MRTGRSVGLSAWASVTPLTLRGLMIPAISEAEADAHKLGVRPREEYAFNFSKGFELKDEHPASLSRGLGW